MTDQAQAQVAERNRRILLADAQLFMAAVSFGLGFVGQKEAQLEHVGPLTFNAARFGLSTIMIVMLLPLLPKQNLPHKNDDRKSHESKDQLPLLASISGEEVDGFSNAPTKMRGAIRLLWYGSLLGIFNFLGSSFQQQGIEYLTSAESSFLSGLYVVFTPLVQVIAPALLSREHKPNMSTWVAVGLSLAGLFITSGASISSVKLGPGETLTLLASFFWTFFILILDIATDKCNAIHITFVQLSVTTLLSIIASYIMEHGEWNLHHLWASWPIMLFLGCVECVGFACGAQGQVWAPPHHAAIIYSSETVWAIMGGYLFLHETLSYRDTLGCLFLLAATLFAKLDAFEALRRFWRRLRPAIHDTP